MLARLRERHGPTVRLDIPVLGKDALLVTELAHIERILETKLHVHLYDRD